MTVENLSLRADVSLSTSLLRVAAADAAALRHFEGAAAEGHGGQVLEGPLSASNAAALRAEFTQLQPTLIGRTGVSVGTGDRLGLATAGHIRAFGDQGAGVVPVLAQQSIREMDRLDRSAQAVMDDATFGAVAAGWIGPMGADCDHIKTTQGIDRGVEAGFTTFTLDPGDHVVDVRAGISADQVAQLPWDELEDDPDSLRRRYVGTVLELEGEQVRVTEEAILAAAVKYSRCLLHTRRLYEHLHAIARYPVEVEIAVDETAFETTYVEHYYLAGELRRLGVDWIGFAPRYVDGFEKGVEFLGDQDELCRNLRSHHAIAEQWGGYKISLHSGSDKYSIYPPAVEATGGQIHLKTSGTTYLCALEIAAAHRHELLEAIWRVSRESYLRARASYQVSADVDRTPKNVSAQGVRDLVQAFDSRQILHVGYGDALQAAGHTGASIRTELLDLLRAHLGEYSDVVAAHLGRHLRSFAAGAQQYSGDQIASEAR